MAKYQTFAPASVDGAYYDASAENPAVLELPDETEPSRDWIPLDDGAEAALKKLAAWDAKDPKEKLAIREKEAADRKKAEFEKRTKDARVSEDLKNRQPNTTGAGAPPPRDTAGSSKRASDKQPV